jgi:hypothetical protein
MFHITLYLCRRLRYRKPKLTTVGESLRWSRDTLYPLKLVLTSPTSGGRLVGRYSSRLRTQAMEFSFLVLCSSHCTSVLEEGIDFGSLMLRTAPPCSGASNYTSVQLFATFSEQLRALQNPISVSMSPNRISGAVNSVTAASNPIPTAVQILYRVCYLISF